MSPFAMASKTLLLAAAGTSLVLAIAAQWSRTGREGEEVLIDRGERVETPSSMEGWARSLCPDPVFDAHLNVRSLLRSSSVAPEALRDALDEALTLNPRSGILHYYRSRLAAELGDQESASKQRHQALRAAPYHGQIHAQVARANLVDAVEQENEELLDIATDAFRRAVAMEAMSLDEALQALQAAEAPVHAFRAVAGERPSDLQRLVDHFARTGRHGEALEVGARIDDLDGHSVSGRVRAHVRVAVAYRQEGLPLKSIEHFAHAHELRGHAREFALDYADVLLGLGRCDAGASMLITAVKARNLTAERLAASLIDARDSEEAIRSFHRRLDRSVPGAAREGALLAARRLGDTDLELELLDARVMGAWSRGGADG